MTADDQPWEIPPLDGAPDVARDSGARQGAAQQGAVLADTRNWPGYGLLFVAAILAITAAVLAAWGFDRVAVTAATITAVFALLGVVLVVLARQRRRSRGPYGAERTMTRPGN
ncbi:hypothetical protein ACL02S_07820 [Nocardia sp. 004]|uniref:hypothetical protein n=1 Tax=Nocardia sp. 004 TaxID=3385978 RepID=UPI0039A04E9E